MMYMTNFMRKLSNIVITVRIASDSDVQAGGAQSLPKKMISFD